MPSDGEEAVIFDEPQEAEKAQSFGKTGIRAVPKSLDEMIVFAPVVRIIRFQSISG